MNVMMRFLMLSFLVCSCDGNDSRLNGLSDKQNDIKSISEPVEIDSTIVSCGNILVYKELEDNVYFIVRYKEKSQKYHIKKSERDLGIITYLIDYKDCKDGFFNGCSDIEIVIDSPCKQVVYDFKSGEISLSRDGNLGRISTSKTVWITNEGKQKTLAPLVANFEIGSTPG